MKSKRLIQASFDNAEGDRITQKYQNGQITYQINEDTGDELNFAYDFENNTAVITGSDGTYVLMDLGGDGKFGTVDDFVLNKGKEELTDEDLQLQRIFDAQGRLKEVTDKATGIRTEFTYDADGNATAKTFDLSSGELLDERVVDPSDDFLISFLDPDTGNEVVFKYDKNGDVAIEVFDSKTDELLNQRIVDLDTGQVLSVKDYVNGISKEFEYAADGSVKVKTFRLSDNELLNEKVFDANFQIQSMKDFENGFEKAF